LLVSPQIFFQFAFTTEPSFVQQLSCPTPSCQTPLRSFLTKVPIPDYLLSLLVQNEQVFVEFGPRPINSFILSLLKVKKKGDEIVLFAFVSISSRHNYTRAGLPFCFAEVAELSAADTSTQSQF
jgi:hypothetical protein